MQYLLQASVFLLMVSIGMSLKITQVLAHWRRLNWLTWLCLVVTTFIIPPMLALLIANLFRLSLAETAGLFLIGVAPGAPLLTRNLSRKGFDMHLAASYQVWAALMVPVMIPVIVALAAKLYQRDVWIPPLALLRQIAQQQFFPLIVGMLIARFAAKHAERSQPLLNTLGNILLTVAIAAILFKLGPELKTTSPLVPIAALLLALGSIGAILMLRFGNTLVQQTFAVCNA